jgi:hypothetical protein
VSEVILKLLARFQYRLANNIGNREANEIAIEKIERYIRDTTDSGRRP